MITFAFIVSTKQFVGSPIACWCPAQFTTSHREYANNICWVSNTYFLPMEDTIPRDHATLVHNAQQKVSYYQWMPLHVDVSGKISIIVPILMQQE